MAQVSSSANEFITLGTEAGPYPNPERSQPANRDTEVVEIRDGEILEFDGLTVTAVDNTHLGIPGVEYDRDRYQSLSFRFDLPDRSIVYTGDTGPSEAVEELARGADVLVAEMMDMEWAIENVRRQNPSIPQPVFERVSNHLRTHHLTPLQVGEMATRVGVGRVVITHFSPGFTDPDAVSGYEHQVRAAYDGEVVIANDLDRF